jgi:hypothetical protein
MANTGRYQHCTHSDGKLTFNSFQHNHRCAVGQLANTYHLGSSNIFSYTRLSDRSLESRLPVGHNSRSTISNLHDSSAVAMGIVKSVYQLAVATDPDRSL